MHYGMTESESGRVLRKSRYFYYLKDTCYDELAFEVKFNLSKIDCYTWNL